MAHHRFPGWSLNKALSAARTSEGKLARRAASSKSALESTGVGPWTCFSTPTADFFRVADPGVDRLVLDIRIAIQIVRSAATKVHEYLRPHLDARYRYEPRHNCAMGRLILWRF